MAERCRTITISAGHCDLATSWLCSTSQRAVGKLITTILRPVTKILSGALKVFGLSNKPSASVSVATGESPNNDLTGQTNRARLYKGRPNIYGQCRVFPDLIQEALFEFVDNNKQLTEWFEVGYGRYTISSIRYSESNLGSLAGASSAIYNPGDVIGTIEVGYQFDDVDNETVPGLNESQDFPAQTATTTAPTSVAIESNQLKAVVLSNDDNFAYFAALAVPHPVSFVINATWNDGGTSVTRNVTGAGNIISSESFIGDDTLSYTTFYIGELSGRNYVSAGQCGYQRDAVHTERPDPSGYRTVSVADRLTQVWVHVLVQLGATAGTTQYRIKFWQVDDDNNQVPGTSEQHDYFFDNDFQVTTRYFRTTHKFVPAAGAGRYAVTIERLDNSNDANVVTLMAIHAVNVRENVVYPEDTIARITIKGRTTATATASRSTTCWRSGIPSATTGQPARLITRCGRVARLLTQSCTNGWLWVSRTWPVLTSPLCMPLPIRCRMLSLGISITPSRMRSSLWVSA
jgi:hypothetical protein